MATEPVATTRAPVRSAPSPARGPVTTGERVLAPDLARGFMLLLIALANAACLFLASTPGVDTTPHGGERVYYVLLFVFAHACALPLFVMTFGYGIVQFARRQEEAGSSPARIRGVLLRRHAWMIALGLVHGLFLFSGDILGGFGVVGIAFTLILLRRSDRFHRLAVVYVGLAAAVVVGLGVRLAIGVAAHPHGHGPLPIDPFPSAAAQSYGEAFLDRLREWPTGTAVFAGIILFAWVGAWAARNRILEEPAKHVRLLRTGLIGGFALAIAGGLPMGLLAGGFLHLDPADAPIARSLYETAGLFGGIGYGCLFGLLGLRWSRPGRNLADSVPIRAVVALGRRSLSCYLFQSVAWLVLSSRYLLDLGHRLGSPTYASAGCALAVWGVSLVVAYRMDRRGYRGPAETLLRRLAYGRTPAR